MEKKNKVPHIPFYFVRHGETDWNKQQQTLCNQDEIPLNQTGLLQATNVCQKLKCIGITKIYSSPLMRAKQTAEIINQNLDLSLKFHEGLRKIVDEEVASTFTDILEKPHTTLIVSHGEIYRILLRILNAKAHDQKAKNCGLYFFRPPDSHSDQWMVFTIENKN